MGFYEVICEYGGRAGGGCAGGGGRINAFRALPPGRYENRGLINRMVTSGGPIIDPLKLVILIIFDSSWVYQTLEDMLSITVSNSHFWKRSGARDMIICWVHVGSHIPGIGYLQVYHGIYIFS